MPCIFPHEISVNWGVHNVPKISCWFHHIINMQLSNKKQLLRGRVWISKIYCYTVKKKTRKNRKQLTIATTSPNITCHFYYRGHDINLAGVVRLCRYFSYFRSFINFCLYFFWNNMEKIYIRFFINSIIYFYSPCVQRNISLFPLYVFLYQFYLTLSFLFTHIYILCVSRSWE